MQTWLAWKKSAKIVAEENDYYGHEYLNSWTRPHETEQASIHTTHYNSTTTLKKTNQNLFLWAQSRMQPRIWCVWLCICTWLSSEREQRAYGIRGKKWEKTIRVSVNGQEHVSHGDTTGWDPKEWSNDKDKIVRCSAAVRKADCRTWSGHTEYQGEWVNEHGNRWKLKYEERMDKLLQ